MDPTYIELSYVQVGCAALLILVNGAVSIVLRLKIERLLFIAAVRTVVQLLLIGLILQWIFDLSRWYTVLALMGVMTVTAGVVAVRRTERRYPGIWFDGLISVWASSWIITAVALGAIVRPEPWYLPQYSIPLLGMVLGNTLSGISLGLTTFGEELTTRRDQVETLLAMGATRWEAAQATIQKAMRTGMIPIINSMLVVGIVSLPGMMTGQLLSGVDPNSAVNYQIVIMFLIASATALGTFSAVLLSYRRLFNARHQFLYTKFKKPADRR